MFKPLLLFLVYDGLNWLARLVLAEHEQWSEVLEHVNPFWLLGSEKEFMTKIPGGHPEPPALPIVRQAHPRPAARGPQAPASEPAGSRAPEQEEKCSAQLATGSEAIE